MNGKPLPESVVRIYALATERQNLDEMSAEDRERIVNDVIGLELLAQQAEKEGLTSSRTLAAQIELQRLQSVARAMASNYLENNPPTDADLRAIYEENLPRLSGQQYKLRHIMVGTKAEADIVIAELNQGADFVALAEARADGPTGPNGGQLGWLTADNMPPTFAAAVASDDGGLVFEGARANRLRVPRDPARGDSAAGAADVGGRSCRSCEPLRSGSGWTITSRR